METRGSRVEARRSAGVSCSRGNVAFCYGIKTCGSVDLQMGPRPPAHIPSCVCGATDEQPPLERPSSKRKDDSGLLLGVFFFSFMFILSLFLWLDEFTQLSVTIGEYCEGLFQCLNSTFYGNALLFASIKKVFCLWGRVFIDKVFDSRLNILQIHLLVLFLTRGCTLPRLQYAQLL